MGGSKWPLQSRQLPQVEGHHVNDILLDTGCSWTLVSEQLVLQEELLEGRQAITIRCAHGNTVLYPLAEVDMEVDGVPVRVHGGCSVYFANVSAFEDRCTGVFQVGWGSSGQQLLGSAMSVTTPQEGSGGYSECERAGSFGSSYTTLCGGR